MPESTVAENPAAFLALENNINHKSILPDF